MYGILEDKLKHLDEASVRNEYKIATYDRYLLPSLRYHLSIHTVHQTHLNKLDMLANQYLKQWAGIPTRGCTNLALFHPYMLGLKAPSQLYMEGHAGNYLNCKVKADAQVKLALDSQLSREMQWVGKSSTIVQCQEIYEKVSDEMLIPTRENCYNYDASISNQMPKLKQAVKEKVQLEYLDKWNKKVRDLVIQGDFLNLLISEQSNVTWKAIIHSVPKGVMEFALRSSTNILATPDNLKWWGKVRSDTCKMCNQQSRFPHKATLFHILNNCDAFLGEAERMTWRHNSILNYIAQTLDENKPNNIMVYSDLPNFQTNGGSIPLNIVVTSSRPDLVIVDSSTSPKTVYLYELTVCFERPGNMESANNRKYARYTGLATDIEDNGFKCKNIPFEVGSRGQLTPENRSRLSILHKLCAPKVKFSKFCQNICKTSLLCSYSIYLSRNDPWTGAELLKPVNK